MGRKKHEAPLPEPLVWTVPQVAAALSLSQAHVYRLVQQHRLPFIRIGNVLRFRPAEIEAWIEAKEVPSVR